MEQKRDARKVSRDVLEELRRQAKELRKRGMTRSEIGEVVGAHKDTVGRWLKLDADDLAVRRCGRRPGQCRRLTPGQERAIQGMIVDKAPDQLKLPFALWTRRSVRELVKRETGVDLPVRTVGDYLRRWGFTPQKPAKRAHEQNPKAVGRWLNEQYPEIKRRAKAEGAEIYWGDETGVRNDGTHGRSYAPKGRTPVARVTARRSSTNMVSAITNQGKVRFHVYDGSMNVAVLKEFCRRLVRAAGRKVFLVLDNLKVHHAKAFKAWLAERPDRIEVFYLPSYSPELNPDEYLNCDLKAGVHGGSPARTREELKGQVRSHMMMLQRKPARVAKYFENENISYAG